MELNYFGEIVRKGLFEILSDSDIHRFLRSPNLPRLSYQVQSFSRSPFFPSFCTLEEL